MFHFGIGVLPKEARYGANFAGLKGDRDAGLREIEQAASRSTWAQNDAKMFLAMINIYYMRDLTKGLRYLNDLTERYPNNIPVLYTLGNVDLLLRKPQTALQYYRRALQNADTNFRTFAAFSNYRIAESHFRMNDFENAKTSLQRFFKGKYERSFRGMALLRLALCYEIAGNRAEAQKGYLKCTQLTPFEPDDKFAIRRAKEYLKQAPETSQIQLLKGVNCVESSRFQEAEQFLRPLFENTALSKEIRSEAAYNLGEAFREQKRNEEAIKFYLKAVELEPERERWTMPWSYYRIATIHYNAGKTDLSRSYIEKAKVFSGYDFEEWLQFNMYRDVSLLKY
jgi:tetratricopeptide (TPR) repeat protein